MPILPADLAEGMLTQSDSTFEVLKIYQFQNDVDAHNDKLQADLEIEFNREFENIFTQLQSRFADPTSIDLPSVDLPVGGFRNAVWLIGEKVLSLVAYHEDREVPFVLLLSVTPRKTK